MSEVGALASGAIVGGAYRIVRPVAEGGMGVIYEVEQIATGAMRALKVMHGQFAGDDRLRARFVREARLAASIPSDHVAQVVDAGHDAATGGLYIVMELLEGVTLSRELRRAGPFLWIEALSILEQIAHALGAAHAAGIVHRDLKPANVFLSRSRQAGRAFTVKLLDFGIAKAVAMASGATASVLGTPAWMAPEQTTTDTPIGPQADVWSLGLLAFLLLTGRHYFPSANAPSAPTAAVLREVVLDPLLPASLRATRLGAADRLPEGFDAWFERCVDRSPDRRFVEAGAAYEALARLPPPTPAGVVLSPRSPVPPGVVRAPLERPITPMTAVEPPAPATRPPSTLNSVTPAPRTARSPGSSRPPSGPLPSDRFAIAAVLAVFAAVAVFFARRSKIEEPAPAPAPGPLAATIAVPPPLIRLHGSNTIGAELAPALAETFLQRRTGAKAVVRRRTSPDEMRVEALDGSRTIEWVEIFAHGTSTAFQDLAAGTCDVGMASRRIRADEAAGLARLGDLASAASERVVALDGIAIIVNPSNPVAVLTKSQIGAVFAGEVRRWSELGGADAPIVVHARDDRSGTFDTFSHLVLSGRALAPGATRHESSDELSDAVAADARAIGFIGLPYVRSAKPVMVKEVSGAESVPLLPSPATVSTEDYALARRLYFYVPPGAPIAARDFADFASTEEGQRTVQGAGFVDLRPTCDPNAPRCASCGKAYREALRGACRMSMDFRFDTGGGDGARLDTRALSDLQRVVTFMGRPEFAGRSLLLLGFSDGTGRADDTKRSQERAEAVGAQLQARGLHVEGARGLGAQMPVADDATDEGRARNRRVEVWLR